MYRIKKNGRAILKRNTLLGQIQTIGRHPRVIPIGNKNRGVSKSDIVRIESETPEQREKERVRREGFRKSGH